MDAAYIFLDFDGVVKDSVDVKSDAFYQLFSAQGKALAEKVRRHHEANGGMSRYEKLPLYLAWADCEVTSELVKQYSDRFSKLVKQKVISSNWVPGVEQFIHSNLSNKTFFLLTATPQSEIGSIVDTLNLNDCFKEVIGAPAQKAEALKFLVNKYNIIVSESVMVGDSMSDYQAANANHIPFILRKTNLNQDMQRFLDCMMIDDFTNE